MNLYKKAQPFVLSIACLFALPVYAAVSEDKAASLDRDLTPTGAERAGNASGTIPAWDGGLRQPLPSGDVRLPAKLFENEKPTLTIDSINVEKYADKLADGTRYMLQNYPGYALNIYPSHRTFAAPNYIYERTRRNATQTTLVNESISFDAFSGGIPFPIPQNGAEAILNHQWNWRGADLALKGDIWFVSSSGKASMNGGNIQEFSFPWAYPDGREDKWNKKLWAAVLVTTTAPAHSAGEKLLIHGPADMVHEKTDAWTYLTGQRRLRKTPNVQYDVPNNFTSGIINFDDGNGFNGAIDRYDWKLVGKQELYVPYNNNNLAYADLKDLIQPSFVNPNYTRWELHRVWVVEATLKSGARHVVPKRRFYLDEDSWQVLVTDQWDAKGQVWKTFNLTVFNYPEVPVLYNAGMHVYNLQAKDYALVTVINDSGSLSFKPLPAEMFTPQSLERSGVR